MTSVSDLINHLETVFLPGFDLSLDRISSLLNNLENPHKRLPPIIHIAGTNGKGSTAAFSRALLESAGYSTHLHTSPHLVNWNERFRLGSPNGGTFVEEKILAETILRVVEANTDKYITVFEILTAVMFVLFAENPADAAIIEVGLGGRLDATNVIDSPAVSIITSLSLDHEAFLGETLALITQEKAGIIKPKRPVVVGQQESQEAIDILEEKARYYRAPLVLYGHDFIAEKKDSYFLYSDQKEQLKLSLPSLFGNHQLGNAATALAGVRAAGFTITQNTANLAMPTVRWPGRMEPLPFGRLSSLAPEAEIWIDGGHNPGAGVIMAQALMQLQKESEKPLFLIVGMISTKDHFHYFQAFQNLTQKVLTVPIPTHVSKQGVPPIDLALKAQEAGLCAQALNSVSDALVFLHKTYATNCPIRILICGSLYLIGSVLEDNETPPT